MTQLINHAAALVAFGAHKYLTQHGLAPDQATLAACSAEALKRELPAALADSRAAMDCGMSDVAVATFQASLYQAGINAAKAAVAASPAKEFA